MYCFLMLIIVVCDFEKVKTNDVREIKLEILRRLQCNLGLLFENCPVDGGWTEWNLWGPCIGRCGQVGQRSRTRECKNPPPANNGAHCTGIHQESKECRMQGCSVNEYRNLIKCDLVKSNEFEILDNVHKRFPSLITRCLESECHYKIVKAVLQEDADYYWNALHCIKHNNGCPEFGGWSDWGEWSDCSSHCGPGQQIKCRSCDNPTPSQNKYKCSGFNCTTKPCVGMKCDVSKSSEWSRWTPWTDCTVSCGQGLSERERECIVEVSQVTQRTLLPTCYGYHIRRRKRDKVLLPLITKSHGCVGSYKEIRPCYLNDCPVNGGWSEWEPWSQCSAGCGLGTQSRSRACSSPPVLGGGQPCIGPITHLRHCFVQPCKYSGELIRREPLTKDFTKKSCCFVRLFLEAGYLVLSARMSRCYLSLITVQKIEHEKWTEVLIMITPSGATMRLDNRSMYYKAKFNCVLRNPNFDSDMVVGYDFKGEIEKLAVNFKKRNLRNSDNLESQKFPVSNISPVLITNVEYNEGEQDESLITLDNLILGPCPKNMKSWSIELVVKTQAAEGAVLVIKDYFLSTFLILLFETHRISLHLASGDCDTEVDFNTDAHLNVWTYIVINYNESECIGFRINGGRRKKLNECNDSQELSCKDHMYLGDVAPLLKKAQMTNFSYMKYVDSMIGTLAYLRIDDEVLDLESLPSRIELETEPFSSETVSYSDNYTELELPFGEQLNLSCLYYLDLSSNDVLARQYWNQSQPFWLKFDTPIDIKNNGTRDIQFDVYDNNRVSQLKTLHYKSREDIEGFYSCWLPYPKKSNGSEILFTYGVSVIQSSLEFESTAAVLLVKIIYIIFWSICITIIIWLLYEYYGDENSGWGIFSLDSTRKRLGNEYMFSLLHLSGKKKTKKEKIMGY
ncbi:uncharacterized protein isoform X3 [Rhodnius prolixus]|uniref:uncharacterized protein isoform X3 n=1 Tax=Rhodnius prolixus TaxID=13249 RepID=UPI003D18AB6B